MVPLVSVFASTLIGIALSAPVEYYATKYDKVDIEMILNNRRMVTYYGACLLSKGPCPPEGYEIKRILPEALKTNCQRCTEKQKAVILHSIKRLRKEYPKVWDQLQSKWDPEGIHVRKFEETFGSYDYAPFVPGTNTNKVEDENKILVTDRLFDSSDEVLPSSSTTTTTVRTVVTTSKSKPVIKDSVLPLSATSASTASPVSTKTQKTTNKPIKTTTNTVIYNPIFPTLPPLPVPNIGASIEATVSFGGEVVGGIVKGLNAIGNRVLETGAEIADVVFKNIAKPL